MKNIYKLIIIISLTAFGSTSCDLTEEMQVQADKAMIFGSKMGLNTYAYSFYRYLPALNNAFRQDYTVDYAAVSNTSVYIKEGGYNSETSTSWSWGELRNINYFIDGCNNPKYCTVDDKTRDNYIGIAKWFRAWFYYKKLTKYGEVPWFEHEIQAYQYDIMYKDRDSRDVIIKNIISDLDFAYNNIQAKSSKGSSTITKWAVAALKSRICLFEASYRKYHKLTGLELSTEELYQQAAKAAKLVIDNSGLSLNSNNGTKGAYRSLFYNQEPLTNEVILAVCTNSSASIFGSQNWWYNSKSYGACWSLTKSFINTYLNIDGTPFTNAKDFETISFYDEVQNRDFRLTQTIRGTDFKMDSRKQVGDIKNVCLTGYQCIKYTLDEAKYDGGARNINSIPLIRYAEVLLNYAEAKAELGTMSDRDWDITVGELRRRAGIVVSANIPNTVDEYLQSTFYPKISNPIILEIRRERAIELVAEGFRFNDLKRWACGNLIQELKWDGINIENIEVPIDINKDGQMDYYFTEGNISDVPASYKSIAIEVNKGEIGIFLEPNFKGGYSIIYKAGEGNRHWYDDGRQYLYPIPAKVIRDYTNEGYTISQNPNWN